MTIVVSTSTDVLSRASHQEFDLLADTYAELLTADLSAYPNLLVLAKDTGKIYAINEGDLSLFDVRISSVEVPPFSTISKSTTITIPNSTRRSWSGTIVDADVTPSSRIFYCFGNHSETSDNSIEDTHDLSLRCWAGSGLVNVSIRASGRFGGSYNIIYRVE